ncbi:hypothetical protein LXA47_26365 [Massilia sp. P8910]|uniref:hypothetical protein n=1 Tax=Massilia antarctica TaxID=2765360 RepID=UPI001E47E52C|nr:hypothetical protein [Massilia antarctica]MCE3607097.1 hypothetical protein [Massilia antarctica]
MFNVAHQLRSVVVHLFLASVPLLVFCFAEAGADIVITSVTAGLLYLAACFAQLIFLATYLGLGNNRTLLTRKVIELHHDALYEECKFSKSYYYWHGIQISVIEKARALNPGIKKPPKSEFLPCAIDYRACAAAAK